MPLGLNNKRLSVGSGRAARVGKGERDVVKTFRALKVGAEGLGFFFPGSFEVGYFYEENSSHITKGACQGVWLSLKLK